MDKPIILLRPSTDTPEEEVAAMRAHFPVVTSRMDVPPASLVVGRMAVLPFYRELEHDLQTKGARLINSHFEHRYIADLGSYTTDLGNLTPPTFGVADIPYLEDDPAYNGFFLKGETNSRKFLWDTHAHAPTKADIITVYHRLTEDALIQTQTIYIRRCLRLKTFFHAPHGLPITNEYRSFVYRDQILATGFYWSSYAEEIPEQARQPPPPAFLAHVARCLAPHTNFYTIDTALTAAGEWVALECNDGQQAGISECDPGEIYANLAKALGT